MNHNTPKFNVGDHVSVRMGQRPELADCQIAVRRSWRDGSKTYYTYDLQVGDHQEGGYGEAVLELIGKEKGQ